MNMKVSPFTILWIYDYLSNRPQFVKINEFLSNTVLTNTGCPQGTVLSPYLFSLYTSDSRESHDLCTLIKYADDTALTGKILNDNHTPFLEAVNRFVDWCDQNYLELNVSKTKEMLIDFRKNKTVPDPVTLKGKVVERVVTFKYLGATIDDSLSWSENTDSIVSKANTRLHCLRKLHAFHVHSPMLQLFFSSMICSVLTFGSTVWGGNITDFDKKRLGRIIQKASYLIGIPQESLKDMVERKVFKKLTNIFNDESHPLRQEFDSLIIARSGRLRLPKVNTERYLKSFVPNAVKIFNSNYSR